MLRSQLGEDLYRAGIKTYLQRHQHGNVVTEDLQKALEEVSGQALDQFFDQWIYHGQFPELDVGYGWDQKTRLARISVKQTQPVNEKVLLFAFPLTVRFKGDFGTVDQVVRVKSRQEDFYFPLESAPKTVRVDPEYTLLARTRFTLPRPMVAAQLKDKDDMVGRLLAVEQLGRNRDKESIATLKEALNSDEYYGVRMEAARALRSIHSQEALDALLASMKQPDARVRQQVVEEIGNFYHEQALEAARDVARTERNPAIQAVAVSGLGAYGRPEVRNTLLEFLNSDSYRNELAVAALEGIRAYDDPSFIGLLLETLGRREADFTSRGLAQGIDTLAWLARNEQGKDNVREFILRYVNSPKRRVQSASLRALGVLGDPKALPVVERFATAAEDTPERKAAEVARAELRANRKPADELRNLREEVLDLQKANRDMNKELQGLKKQFEALDSPVAARDRRATEPIRSPKAAQQAGRPHR